MYLYSDKKLFYLYIILLLIIGFISYSHIFSNPFVVDDDEFIVKWDAVRSLKNIPRFIKGLIPFGHEGVYRPVRTILYAFAYKLFGDNVFGYHLFSIVIHLSSTILVYLILVSSLRDYIIPFISALFFAIHPVHAESITYMTSSFDMSGVVFILLSFYLYIQYTIRKKKAFYVMSIIFSTTGYFTYEVTLIFPLLIILYNLCFKINNKFRICFSYFAGMLFYIAVRLFMIGIGGKGGYVLNSFYYTMLIMPKAFLKYVSIMIFPAALTMNHELYPGIYSMLYVGYDKNIMLTFSFFDSRVLIPLIIILAIIGIGIKLFKRQPVVSFSIGWFFISLVPVTNVIPSGILMAEKYLYLASFGYCLILGYLFGELYKNKKFQYFTCIIFCALALFYFKTTIIRNLEWKNPLFLWDTEAERFPDNSFANNNLGYAYMRIGKNEEAIKYLGKAKALRPFDLQVRENLEVCYINSGRYDDAINECKEILQIAPNTLDCYKSHVNMSAAYNGKGMFTEAIEEAKKALVFKPDCAQAYTNLITAYVNIGDCSSALKYYNEAKKLRVPVSVNPFLAEKLQKDELRRILD